MPVPVNPWTTSVSSSEPLTRASFDTYLQQILAYQDRERRIRMVSNISASTWEPEEVIHEGPVTRAIQAGRRAA